jgi:hypothetical protein
VQILDRSQAPLEFDEIGFDGHEWVTFNSTALTILRQVYGPLHWAGA